MASLGCRCLFLQVLRTVKPIRRPNIHCNHQALGSSLHTRCFSKKSGDMPMEIKKTTIQFLSKQTDQGQFIPAYVYKYGPWGFQVDANKIIGSVALFRDVYFSWKVANVADITPESLTLFTLTQPKIEILVLGVGRRTVQLSPEVRKFAQVNRLSLEVQDTPNACATYNFLMEEGRMVAAALIPPDKMTL